MKIIPLFLPYAGCVRRCSYCQQHIATGISKIRSPADAGEFLAKAASGVKGDFLVGFYGGSFLALPFERISEYLDALPVSGRMKGIRISTTAESIEKAKIMKVMKKTRISAIEIGIESFNGDVLEKCGRPNHPFAFYRKKAGILKGMKIPLHIHLLCGLPGDSKEKYLDTARKAARLAPAGVRIHPAIVLKGTALAGLYAKGEYCPLDIGEAADLTALSLKYFIKKDIPVTRLGLFPDENLLKKGNIIAGPFHPAFGSIVWSRYYRKMLEERMHGPGRYMVYAPEGIIAHIIGFKKENMEYFNARGITIEIKPGSRLSIRKKYFPTRPIFAKKGEIS